MLFALLATFAPVFDAPLPTGEIEKYLSAPSDPRSDATGLLPATLDIAEDLEEEDGDGADDGRATFPVPPTLDEALAAEHPVADARLLSFLRLSANFGTGPPTL